MRCSGWLVVVVLVLALVFVPTAAGKNRTGGKQATEKKYRAAKLACDDQCISVPNANAARQICVLQCLSPGCYEDLYGEDALEEGEIDSRARQFKVCAKKDLQGPKSSAQDESSDDTSDEIVANETD